jgi:hypothetical protein
MPNSESQGRPVEDRSSRGRGDDGYVQRCVSSSGMTWYESTKHCIPKEMIALGRDAPLETKCAIRRREDCLESARHNSLPRFQKNVLGEEKGALGKAESETVESR